MENTTLYEDIMQGLKEIHEYQEGKIELKTSSMAISEDFDLEHNYKLQQKIIRLSAPNRQRVEGYIDSLLQSAV